MKLALAPQTQRDPPTERELFEADIQKSVSFAVASHAGQFRKHSGLPYITHCFDVLAQIAEWNVVDPNTVKVMSKSSNGKRKLDMSEAVADIICWKAALCHDIREERPDISKQQMANMLGEEAASVCEELSFFYDPSNNLTEAQQKADYIKTFMNKSIRAIVCKCADRCCNTLNFIQDAPDYAGKYWRKGEPLFDAMITRGEEIGYLLGPDVFPRMKFSRDTINRQIFR